MNKPALVDDYIRDLAGKGSVFLAATLPDDLYYGQPGQCFANALLQALSSKGKYLYCEGLGIRDGEAYAHAWLTDKDQEFAYDVTWRVVNNKTGEQFAAPAMYKGVVLDTESAKNYVLSTKTAGIVPNRDARPRMFKQLLKRSEPLWAN